MIGIDLALLFGTAIILYADTNPLTGKRFRPVISRCCDFICRIGGTDV